MEVFGAPFLKGQVGGEASCTFLRGHEILGRAFEGGAQESNCAPTLHQPSGHRFRKRLCLGGGERWGANIYFYVHQDLGRREGRHQRSWVHLESWRALVPSRLGAIGYLGTSELGARFFSFGTKGHQRNGALGRHRGDWRKMAQGSARWVQYSLRVGVCKLFLMRAHAGVCGCVRGGSLHFL